VGCDYFQGTHQNLEAHFKAHTEMFANIKALGWFWGSIRTMTKANAATTMRGGVGEGPVIQCGEEGCGKGSATKTNLTRHFTQDHTGERRNRPIMPHRQLFQTMTMGRREAMVALR
jgi:hypothetical protein